MIVDKSEAGLDARALDIGLEHGPGLRPQPALVEIHDQEGQIVERVGAGERLVELERVEQHRHTVEQHDVAEMQVAMAVPHPAGGPARVEQPGQALELGERRPVERRHGILGQDVRHQLLEVARQLAEGAKQHKPDVTYQFVFFDGEEAVEDWTHDDSVYGSRYYVSALPAVHPVVLLAALRPCSDLRGRLCLTWS